MVRFSTISLHSKILISNFQFFFTVQTSNDRLTFLAEWRDTLACVNWKFNLFFYTSDETVELVSIHINPLIRSLHTRLSDLQRNFHSSICSNIACS